MCAKAELFFYRYSTLTIRCIIEKLSRYELAHFISDIAPVLLSLYFILYPVRVNMNSRRIDFPGKKSSYTQELVVRGTSRSRRNAVKAAKILRGFANNTRYLRSAIEVDNYRFDMVCRTNTGSNNLCGSHGCYVGTPDFTRWYFHSCKRWCLMRTVWLLLTQLTANLFYMNWVKDNLTDFHHFWNTILFYVTWICRIHCPFVLS